MGPTGSPLEKKTTDHQNPVNSGQWTVDQMIAGWREPSGQWTVLKGGGHWTMDIVLEEGGEVPVDSG